MYSTEMYTCTARTYTPHKHHTPHHTSTYHHTHAHIPDDKVMVQLSVHTSLGVRQYAYRHGEAAVQDEGGRPTLGSHEVNDGQSQGEVGGLLVVEALPHVLVAERVVVQKLPMLGGGWCQEGIG